MIKGLLPALLLLACCSIADAAPSAPAKVVTGTPANQKYWLSDGLNRLVFWKAPQATQKR